jgi:hypothetical protein
VAFSCNLARTFYASTELVSTPTARTCPLSGLVRDVSTANARSPEELPEGKSGDQRATADAGCEEDQFSSNDLHSYSCRDGDEGEGPLLQLGCAVFIGTGNLHD